MRVLTWTRERWGWLVVAMAVGIAACAGPVGLRHRVERGETLYRIGKAYGVAVEELARVNEITDPARIEVGHVLVIPHATRAVPVNVVTPERARADRPKLPELPFGPHPFVWPLSTGTITAGFAPRGVTHHDGVDISCEPGAPVRVSRAGHILYSDTLRGYGNLIIVEHDNGYATVYAHNQENRVETGVAVRQGDAIASCGESGETSGPHLHFEVRKDNIARNPLFYLPGLPAVAGGATARALSEAPRSSSTSARARAGPSAGVGPRSLARPTSPLP
jgi:murein DD-endopeptidase MepM/ murein hydrolase activator NlpD